MKPFSLPPLLLAAALLLAGAAAAAPAALNPPEPEALPAGAVVRALEITPAAMKLDGAFDAAQVLVTAELADGTRVDATRLARIAVDPKVGAVSPAGLVHAAGNGRAELEASLGGRTARAALEVVNHDPAAKVDFLRDVNPVLNQLGCSSGPCHGSKDGKGGFKLSLRGYDPEFDVRSLVDDHAGRRVNLASPDDSLMLLKATGAVPHEGGPRTAYDDKYYRILRAWIAGGAKLDLASPRVASIEVSPRDPVLQRVGSRQQMKIIATYADGRRRDVTAEGFIESGNQDVAVIEHGGLVRTLRRGEAPLLARFEGAYAATTVTVMGDRAGFEWREPEKWNRIDEFTAAKWRRLKILPSELSADADFLRRVHLDLTGLPPSAEEVRAFLADARPVREKRDAVIDRLIGSPDYVDHWANKWADLLQVNRKFLGEDGARQFREWIRAEVAANTPYDAFARKILTASGSNRENPAASYYKILRTPTETMENTTHLFLATRFNCNKCHDHPFERWTQDQYYDLAAYFARVDFKRDPQSGARTIAGTAVEGAKPLYEVVFDKPEGEIRHDRTGKETPPAFPYPAKFTPPAGDQPSRRDQLAAWMTSPDNRYFALSYVNRVWGYLNGVGLIEPIDDIRAGNPPSNPELLAWLTEEFVRGGFDVRKLQALICKSRTYQLSLATNRWNSDDNINYSHALARRLPAEVLLDSVFKATGSTPEFPGVKAGTRAAQLPDSAIDVQSGFLASLGRPPRESACECERTSDLGLGSVMALLSGPTVSGAINDRKNALAALVAQVPDDRRLVDEVFLRTLGRHATDKEAASALESWRAIDSEHRGLNEKLAERERWWAPISNEKERLRADAIAAARAKVEARLIAVAPQAAEAERKREERIAAAEKALADHEALIPGRRAAFEESLAECRTGTVWHPLVINTVNVTNGGRLQRLEDNSYLAVGPVNGLQDYTFNAESLHGRVTALILEVLPHESLPRFGPGLARDGNFVLSEFFTRWTDKGGDREFKDAEFRAARADFTQANYDVFNAINLKADAGRDGWAVGGRPGEPHWARFAFPAPVGEDKGARFQIFLQQRFRDTYMIGRFRLWYTTSEEALEHGVPVDVAEALAVPAAERNNVQVTAIAAFQRESDATLRKLGQALFTARLQVPEDPELAKLKAELAAAEQPVPVDPILAQLRADAELSTRQAADRRLTGVQDLAWALVNTPAFLFNR